MARSPGWQFQLPTRIHFGRGRLRELGELAAAFGGNAMLVGYADPGGLEPTYLRAGELLGKAGLSVTEFFEVPPDPGAELAAEGAALARAAGVDVVVAVGGGSVIDAAKGIALLARLGGTAWDYVVTNPDSRPANDKVPLVAVPTTAGTGAEVSNVAVLTCRSPASQADVDMKGSIAGPAVSPEVALVDPELTLGCPPMLTAACGSDALGHAIESWLSRRTNPISSLLGGRAVGLIVDNLAQAVADPADPGPREAMALAATLAGAAFNEAGVVVAHAIAQALGGVLHVPHGLAVAVATPVALRYNAERCVSQYAELARWCGIAAGSPEASAARFVERIVELLRSIGLPERIDVPPDAPENLIDVLIQNARQSAPAPITLNPRKVDDAALREMFNEVVRFRGK
jgi:alcohol dehydrogenase class IV